MTNICFSFLLQIDHEVVSMLGYVLLATRPQKVPYYGGVVSPGYSGVAYILGESSRIRIITYRDGDAARTLRSFPYSPSNDGFQLIRTRNPVRAYTVNMLERKARLSLMLNGSSGAWKPVHFKHTTPISVIAK